MNFNIKPFFKDIFLTFAAEALVLVSFFIAYRLIAGSYGPDGVGEYSLVKRAVGFLQPFLLLGLGVGLPRYIAIAQDEKQKRAYIKAGAVFVAVGVLASLIVINIFKTQFAETFFGAGAYADLIFPFSLFLAGLVLHTLVYSCFRGASRVVLFNSLQIINLALTPVLLFFILRYAGIGRVVGIIGVLTCVISLAFFLFFWKDVLAPVGARRFLDSAKEMLVYSFPRFVSSLIYAGLISLPPILAAHFASVKEAGYLSVSQSLLAAAGSVIAPLGLVLLPKISNMISQKREEEIKENVGYLIGAAVQCSIFICCQMVIFADVIINYWLGPGFSSAVIVARIVFLSMISSFVCGCIGNVLEASKVKPINLFNLLASFFLFLILSGLMLFVYKIFSPAVSLSIAFSCGMTLLGVLTYAAVRKIYPDDNKKDGGYFISAVAINAVIALAAIFAKPALAASLFFFAGFEIAAGLLYLVTLWAVKIDWIRKVPKNVFNFN